MISSSILNTKGAVLLSAIFAMGLMLTGCGGSDNDGSKTSMPDVMDPPTTGPNDMPDVMDPPTTGPNDMSDVMDPPTTGPNDMSDLGEWAVVRENGQATGYEHTGYELMAKFDAAGENPTITASSPMHQPTVAGTWSGRWSARYTALTSDHGALDETDDGTARINVTIAGSNVDAVLTYTGVDILGLPSSLSSGRASVTNGRFAPSIALSIPTESGGSVSRTFRGLGQFGGTDQNGVVGYVSGQDFRSAFYGDRQ